MARTVVSPTTVQRAGCRRHRVPAAAQALAAATSAVVLSGFTQEEIGCLNELSPLIWPETAVELLLVNSEILQTPVATLNSQGSSAAGGQRPQHEDAAAAAAVDAAQRHGRIIFFLGGPAQQQAAVMNTVLVEEMEVAPAIVAAAQTRHAGMTVAAALESVRAAHAAFHSLVLPVQTSLEGGRPVPPLGAPPALAMNLVCDRGAVLTSTGGTRVDESSVVVIDGLVTEEERRQLLSWITAPGHDHSGAPPATKWERACVDRAGDAATWGLRQEAMDALRESPPDAAVALQARVAALYPEWVVAHMPCEALMENDQEQPLSTHVANAVVYGDPCQWHIDADPSCLPPGAPFTEHCGYYYNREPGKPLFVTMMAYLNDQWREEWFAETLLGDPETGTGVFVQPRPGRVVLMDQDLPHRISSPSKSAPGPRYSLVWKLVLWPREHAACGGAGAGASGRPALPGQQQQRAAGGERSPAASSAAAAPGLSRPEWGPPQRIGSAAFGRGGAPLPLDLTAAPPP